MRVVDSEGLPLTGTCDLITTGRRSGLRRRVEIWYVVIDGQIVGAVGVGGGSGEQDTEVAKAGIQQLVKKLGEKK